MSDYLGIQRFEWDNRKFSVIYYCPQCESITNLEVHGSGQVYTYVDRGSQYHPVVKVVWEDDRVQIHITCHCNEKIEFNRQGKSASIEVFH